MSEKNHESNFTEDQIYKTALQVIKLENFPKGDDLILDIGAGGEGIIEILEGKRVIGIDKNKRELVETDNDSLKIVMDATDLKFLDESFGLATAFFCLMYIPNNVIQKIFYEINRILKTGGSFYVWDIKLNPDLYPNKKIYAIMLKVILPNGKEIETGYGTKMRNISAENYIQYARKAGFEVKNNEDFGMYYKIEFWKPIQK
ncbi:MAG: class I SAM-dependent methyltransferase [Promethearchaeota archaeon]